MSLRDQIYKTCLAAIVDGRLAEGARLPSARQLAVDWRISRNTVDDAIAQLQAEGFLVRRVGDGTFVADAGARGAARAGKAARARARSAARRSPGSRRGAAVPRARTRRAVRRGRAVPCGNAGARRVSADAVAATRARRCASSGGGLLGYFPSLGHGPLREATARHLATTRGIDCEPGAGDDPQQLDAGGRSRCAACCSSAADTAWIEDPCFPNLRSVLAMSGARIVPVPVDAHGLDVDEGARARGAAR